MTFRQRSLASLVPVAIAALVLSGCGSSGEQAVDKNASAGAAGSAGGSSYPMPDCTGQDPAVCVQDGFDPSSDGFSFENWAVAGELGATEMVALFGRSMVCTPNSKAGSCTLYPAAHEWMKQANEGMTGGHCEGMAVMSERLFLGASRLASYDKTAAATYDLEFENSALKKAIDTWFITQLLPEPSAAAADSRALTPSQIAAEIAAGFKTRKGYTLGIYAYGGGHAVTPLAVTREGKKIAISIYDNNYPGTIQRIMVDPSTEKWSYAAGSTNPQNASDIWSGTTGTMDLTPMDARVLPEFPPFASELPKGAAKQSAKISSVLVTSPDPQARVGITATVNGKQYDLSDPTVAPPSGVQARPTLAGFGFGGGESITIDSSKVKSFTLSPTVVNGSSAKTPITMSIDSPARPRVTLRSAIAEGADSGAAFDVDPQGRVTVSVAPDSKSTVNVANGLNGVEFPVASGENLEVDGGDSRGNVEVSYVDDNGEVLGTYDVEYDNPDGDAVDTVVEFDPATGKFTSRSMVVEPEDIDEEAIQASEQNDVIGADQDSNSDSEATADAGSNSDSSMNSDSGSDSETDSGSGANSDSGSDPGANSDSGSDPGANSSSGANSDSGSGANSDSGSDQGGDPAGDSGSESSP